MQNSECAKLFRSKMFICLDGSRKQSIRKLLSPTRFFGSFIFCSTQCVDEVVNMPKETTYFVITIPITFFTHNDVVYIFHTENVCS